MNINKENTCLILTVDTLDCRINQNDSTIKRDFEKESISCVTYWRQRGGFLADIPIHVLSLSPNDIGLETLTAYDELNVTYEHLPEIGQSIGEDDLGFMKVHYSGRHFEQTLSDKFDYFIHIDLDMELLREIPSSYYQALTGEVSLGSYTAEDAVEASREVFYFRGEEPVRCNTDFIISKSNSNFYHKYVYLFENFSSEDRSLLTADGHAKNFYYLEEFVGDKLVVENDDYSLLTNYQMGEGYDFYSKIEDVSTIFFWHMHKNQPLDQIVPLLKARKVLLKKLDLTL